MQSLMQDQDVFIKDEGYAAVKFLSDKAKEIAHSLGISNCLQNSLSWKSVWNKDTKEGSYESCFEVCEVDKLIGVLTNKGLKVETEI